MGGKHRQSKIAVQVMSRYIDECNGYVEPFCGAMGMAEHMVLDAVGKGISVELSDNSEPLVSFWNALIAGTWEPPAAPIDEETWKHYKKKSKDPANYDDPMLAWCGHAFSFGGKWFAAFARSRTHSPEDMHRTQVRSTLRKAGVLRQAVDKVYLRSYADTVVYPGDLLFLDPPYASALTTFKNSKGFNTKAFWDWAALKSFSGPVFVTEFQAPPGWTEVYSWGDTMVRHHRTKGTDGTRECLYIKEDGYAARYIPRVS